MKRKNVITIIADDMGAWATKGAGNKEVITPNIDYLADEGISFSNFYCVSPVCSPARASIYSGTIPSSHGVFDWVASGNLDKEELGDLESSPEFSEEDKPISYMDGILTYTELMDEVGYRCSLSGKWHLGDSLNPQNGYTDWYTLGRGGCEYMHPDIVQNGKIHFKNEYVTHLITENALEMIDKFTDEEPHYLNVAYTAPHSPWEEKDHPERYRVLYEEHDFHSVPDEGHHPWQVPSAPVPNNKEERREYLTGYYAAITAMDEGIGKMIQLLKEKELYEDTLIIFTSDNGMNMGHHGIWGKGNGTYPLNLYDSSIKVPMIMSWPSVFPKNKTIKANRSHYDIFPTLVDYLDLPTEGIEYGSLPGKSLRSVIENYPIADKENTIVYDEYGSTRMIRDNRYKLIKRFPYGPDEFYDLFIDESEKNNLIDNENYQKIIKKMFKQLIRWFNKYTNPDIDGNREAVSGAGQLKLAGLKSDGQNVYKSIPPHLFDENK